MTQEYDNNSIAEAGGYYYQQKQQHGLLITSKSSDPYTSVRISVQSDDVAFFLVSFVNGLASD